MNETWIPELFDGFLPPPSEDCLKSVPDALAEQSFVPSRQLSDSVPTGLHEADLAFHHQDSDPDELDPEEDEHLQRLTQDDSEVLERLAEWLIETRIAADDVATNESVASEMSDDSNPGLFRLVEEFTALRHDVKLQAKSARGLQDQSESLLTGLDRAIERFQSIEPREQQAVHDAMKPLIESMIDLDASLERGRIAAETAKTRWLSESTDSWRQLVETELLGLPIWKRWFLKSFSSNLASSLHARFVESWSATQNAQVDGYRLIQNRLRRLLKQHDVEQIETIGHLTDPNRMTVIEVIDRAEMPAGSVVDELRPGYLWHGQLLRYAEVRAVRSRAGTSLVAGNTDAVEENATESMAGEPD